MKAKLTLDVGILIRSQIRNALKEFQFNNGEIEFLEIKGLFESRFIVKGEYDIIESIQEQLGNHYG